MLAKPPDGNGVSSFLEIMTKAKQKKSQPRRLGGKPRGAAPESIYDRTAVPIWYG
jgi:hypothetical protein